MMSKYRRPVCMFGKYMQNNVPVMLAPISCPHDSSEQIRTIKKHWNQKYRKERKQKFIKVDLPNFDEDTNDLSREAIRSRLKKYGLLPNRDWSERPIFVSSTPNIFESYVVPEGDGKFSAATKEGAKQKVELIEKKSRSYMAVRKIKSYDETFSVRSFPVVALDIYEKAHKALANKAEENTLLQYVTEAAYPLMIHNVEDKTVRWEFLESLEPARVVHARCTSLISKDNVFAQVTVRFHTQQLLCIYDRFGRLMKGSEVLRKDVLDYVVFEKHLSNMYGIWRIHGKIVPSWMPPEEIAAKTYMLPSQKEDTVSKDAGESVAEVLPPEALDVQKSKETPSATK